MKELNCMMLVFVKIKKTNKRVTKQVSKDPATVSKSHNNVEISDI